MSDWKKKLLGFISFWPFIYFPIFILFIFLMAFLGNGNDLGVIILPFFVLLFILHFLTIMSALGMMIYYIIDVFKNPNVDEDKRVVWVLVLVLAGVLANPIYWYMNIWKGEFPEDEETFRGLPGSERFQSDVNQTNRYEQSRSNVPEPMSWRDPE